MKKINTLKYVSPFGSSEDVALMIEHYSDNNNLCIQMLYHDTDYDAWLSQCFITLNYNIVLPGNQAFVKSYSENVGVLEFVLEYGLGKLIKYVDGFPLVEFDMDVVNKYLIN